MANSKAVQLDVQLNTKELERGVVALSGLEKVAAQTGGQISRIFGAATAELDPLVATFQNLMVAITDATVALQDLTQVLIDQSGSDLFFNILSNAIGGLSLACDLFTGKEVRDTLNRLGNAMKTAVIGLPGTISESVQLMLAGVMDASFLSGNKLTAGIKDYVAAVKSVAPEVGTFAAMFPNLSMAISGAGQKIAEFGSTIGTVFSSFGTAIAQIATSTGAWIANTAAKAANTAAQWAQIAAATAWQGICAAATAVTTAFGAAMNFLTSPIGLVVLGIAALIAIIVLLVKNWDTVSAAVVNFMDILRNALEKFDAFVQGIFNIDWTKYLGPLGNVLNAFFANVENIEVICFLKLCWSNRVLES